ncbi:MAG TPA: hypothetical protein VGJ31_01215 [Dongiaceae bacterium]
MLSLAEISHATYGAWRLALFDAGGMRYFDRSLEGFWRSFRVALLVAPGAILLAWLDLADGHAHGGWFRIGAGEVITYVLSWTAFPLAAYYLTQFIGRSERYLGYITADNWASVIETALFLVAGAIAHTGIIPKGYAQLVPLAANIAALIYEWFIARTALNLSRLGALGIVLLAYIIALTINIAANEVMQVG